MSRSLFANLAQRFEPQSELARREFLKLTLAAGAGLLISGPDMVWSKETKKSWGGRRILVVGAGFAGLACAHELLSAGCDVTILEARNRVGGRVQTLPNFIKGKAIEGGGELIGSNHPTWLTYANKFYLHLDPVESEQDWELDSPCFFRGQRLDAKTLYDQMKIVQDKMTTDACSINVDEPWLSENAANLDQLSAADWLGALDAPEHGKIAFESELQANNNVALRNQSYLGNLAQVKGGGLENYWTHSEDYRCHGGNDRLAQKFFTVLQSQLRLNTPVRSIETTDMKAVVRTSANEVIEADDIVLAIPPSVWPNIRFEPDLADSLKPQMGLAVKYITSVKTKFWHNLNEGPDAFSDTMVSMTWDPTGVQKGSGAALTAFSGGDAASTCRLRYAAEGKEAYTEVLEKLFPGYRNNIVKTLFMDWPSMQWTMAGYSFPSPRQITRIGSRLRNGIGRLHFAGEHTCFKFVGYMEGALNSGASLAKRLVAESPAATASPAREQLPA